MHTATILFDALGGLFFLALIAFACLPSAAVRSIAARLFDGKKKPRKP